MLALRDVSLASSDLDTRARSFNLKLMKLAVAVGFRDGKTDHVEVPQVFLYRPKDTGSICFRGVTILATRLLGPACPAGRPSPTSESCERSDRKLRHHDVDCGISPLCGFDCLRKCVAASIQPIRQQYESLSPSDIFHLRTRRRENSAPDGGAATKG